MSDMVAKREGGELMAYQVSRKILCVDDDANFLNGLKRQFHNKYDVTTATSGEEGLQVLEEKGPFAVIITDHHMPGMTGVEFLKQISECSPHTVPIMLTGVPDLDVAVGALHEGHVFRFLSKPCPPDLLSKTIKDSLDQYRLVMMERILSDELNRANNQLRILNEELEERVAKRTASIRRLHQFVSDLNGLDTVGDVADVVVATTADMLQSRRVSLMLPDESGEYLSIIAAVGVPEEVKRRIRVPIGSPIAGTVFAESQTVVVNNVGALGGDRERYDTDFFVSEPLASTSLDTPAGPVGVLNVTDRVGKGGYDDEALSELKAITEAAAIAIQSHIRFQERNEARDATIVALAKLAEHRDPETGAHLERVQDYCRMICVALASKPKYASIIDGAFIENIVRSSPLHDIGKVGVPDQILLKPGRLTPEEFEIMKRHSTIGGDTIRSLIDKGKAQAFLHMGMEIAYYHHEKYDGSGYPFGLAGDAIPLSARIVALADVYDALTSRRVYKKAFSHTKAVSIIQQDMGTHFDPEIVEAFFCCEKEFEQLARAPVDIDLGLQTALRAGDGQENTEVIGTGLQSG